MLMPERHSYDYHNLLNPTKLWVGKPSDLGLYLSISMIGVCKFLVRSPFPRANKKIIFENLNEIHLIAYTSHTFDL